MFMSDRMLIYVVLGFALFGTVALKRLLERLRLPLPVVYIALGYALFKLPLGLGAVRPVQSELHGVVVEYVTEFAVIVSLLAAGLSIDRPFSIRPRDSRRCGWLQVWPLLGITMPVTIIALAAAGHYLLGLGLGGALLLGAVLSPTDPVLARSVQVGPPGQGSRDDVRFNLTVEAGLNDGLAFPFTYLAMAVAAATATGGGFGEVLLEWVGFDVAWRCLAGVGVGLVVGRLTSAIMFSASAEQTAGVHRAMGVVIFGTLFAAYGVAEMIEGYGFLAVFVGAVTVRQCEPDTERPYHAHSFVHQVEQIVLVALLLGIGGLVASGTLDALTPMGALVGGGAVILLRPLAGWLALLGPLSHGLPRLGRSIVAFSGIRGLGTLYYLAYATNHGSFEGAETVLAVSLFAILVSVVVHGTTVPYLVRRAEERDDLAASTSNA